MAAILDWSGDDEEPVPSSFPSSQHRTRGRRLAPAPGELPPDIQAAIWRGDQLGSPVTHVVSSGFDALDAELPGAGWPCQSLTEILQPQSTVRYPYVVDLSCPDQWASETKRLSDSGRHSRAQQLPLIQVA